MAQEAKEIEAKARFVDSIKEPEYVVVTPEMVAAGLDRLSGLTHDEDPHT